jgi:hypothetical protein
MKLILAAIALVAIFGSLWADYRWRQWMKRRKEVRNEERDVN